MSLFIWSLPPTVKVYELSFLANFFFLQNIEKCKEVSWITVSQAWVGEVISPIQSKGSGTLRQVPEEREGPGKSLATCDQGQVLARTSPSA